MQRDSRESVLSWKGALSVAALWLLGVSIVQAAAVGRTAGTFNVGANGAASYAIPIFTPPGPHGMQPSVALTYSSNGGGGYVGRGWTVSGLSAITRCNKTFAQDAMAGPISPGVYDAYCLDGVRLRLVSGYYGQSGSVYATEIADFSRITAIGNTYHWVGPLSWTVERKDGSTYTYGNTSDSCISGGWGDMCWAWFVNEIQDRAGNKVKFTYKTQDTDTKLTTHPTKIEWTQTSAGSGIFVYSMDFSYSSNGNPPASRYSGYLQGEAVRDTDLLTSISVKNSGTTIRKYALGYETSPTTGAKRLITITECSDAAETDCLSPTTVAYQDGSAGISSTASFTASGAITEVSGKFDYDGDGFKDLTYRRSGAWYVRFSNGSGSYGSEISTGNTEFTLMGGDPFGTGRDVIMGFIGTNYWHAFKWNGSSFSAVDSGIPNISDTISLTDVDGDGRDDMVFTTGYDYSYAVIPIWSFLSTSSGSTLSFNNWQEIGGYTPQLGNPPDSFIVDVYPTMRSSGADPLAVDDVDIDGDGRAELYMDGWSTWIANDYSSYGWGSYNAILGRDNNSAAIGERLVFPSIPWSMGPIILTQSRLNSDRCSDQLQISSVDIANCAASSTSVGTTGWVVGAVDWNGDGRQDVLQYISGSTLSVQLSTGEGLASAISTTLPSTCGVFLIDTDGDGLAEVGCLDSGTGLSIYPRNGTLQTPDLAVAFTDGFGVSQSVSYVHSTHSGYTPGSGATYPQQDITRNMVLVRTVTATDGIGGTYTNTYSYFGATRDVQGRGMQGFEKIENVDSRNGMKVVRKFKREFPYSGMQYEESVYQSASGPLISQHVATITHSTLDATSYNQRYFPYASSSVTDKYEVGGTRDGDWLSRTAVSNTFDSSGNLTAITSVVTDKDSSSALYGEYWTTATSQTITPNTTYWCLGLPSAVSVTRSSSVYGETTVYDSKGYSPDYVNCRQNAETVGSGALQVDTAYGFDGFGNVNAVSVTGRNPNGSSMTARTVSTTWGSANGTTGGTGQFPVQQSNALSQTTSRTFHPTFGSLATETDPNGIVVANNTYDSFGRVSRAMRADGTSTVYTLYTCASISACVNGDISTGGALDRTVIAAQERDTLDAAIATNYSHLDMFDREIIHNEQLPTGYHNRVSRVYDSMGRVLKETPPCDNSTCTQYWVTNTYDLLGRLSTQSRPQSQSVSTPVTTTFGYAGRTQTVTDPQSKVTTKVMDVNGAMRQSKDHDNYSQLFAYDAAGNLKQVTDSLSNTLFTSTLTYGGIKPFQTATADMNLGSWSYTYNSLGELVAWSDANTNTFSQTYDLLSRITSRTDDYEAETTTWTWGTSAGSKNIGRLAGVSMTGYSEALAYDSVGRPVTRSITTDQTYDIDTAYSSQGLIDTVTYPTSTASTRVKVKYGYAYGILQSVTDWTSGSAGTVYWTADSRNVRGQTTQETLGNGVVTTRAFDAVTGWLSSLRSGPNTSTHTLQNLSYAYDLLGNVTQRQESTQGLTESFYYDNLYRLDYSTLSTGGSPTTNLDLTYDAMGNITQRSDVNGNAAWTYHGSKKHAVTSTGTGGTAYSYDANGNMTTRGTGNTLTWASYNYPTQLTTPTETTNFSYGPDRQYYKQDYAGPGGGETTYYVGGLLEKVVTGGGTDWRHYIQAEGQTVAIVSRTTSGNAVYYPLEDNQGSGSTLTDASGTNLVRQSYGAFGLPRDGADWDGAVPGGDQAVINGISRRGYTSHSMLGNMGLIHMNGRVQDAITGRFLSPDPTIPNAGFTQSYNRYAYVDNNPMSFIDPSGFTPFSGGGDYMLSSSQVLMGLAMCQDDNGEPCGGWDVYHQALARESYQFMMGFSTQVYDWYRTENDALLAEEQAARAGGGEATPGTAGRSGSGVTIAGSNGLKITVVRAARQESNEVYSYQVRWQVSGNQSGYIIQHVKFTNNIRDAAGNVVSLPGTEYWEAWKVVNGVVYVGNSSSQHRADTFQNGFAPPNTSGTMSISGQVAFMPNYTLAPGDGWGSVSEALSLPATYTQPTGFPPPGGTTAHTMVVTFNNTTTRRTSSVSTYP